MFISGEHMNSNTIFEKISPYYEGGHVGFLRNALALCIMDRFWTSFFLIEYFFLLFSFLTISMTLTRKLLKYVLIFSKGFRAGFWSFSTFKYSVKKGTNSCKVCPICTISKLMTTLMFKSGFVVHSVCHYWLIDV